jgi:hypothetical protein
MISTAYILALISAVSIMAPLVASIVLIKKLNTVNPFTLFITFAGATELTGGIMALHGIHNQGLYALYTGVEFTFFVWLLLGYATIKRFWFVLHAGIISLACIALFNNDKILSHIECFTLYVLTVVAIGGIKRKSIEAYEKEPEYIITWSILLYSLNMFFYKEYGAIIYLVINITVNLGYTWGLYYESIRNNTVSDNCGGSDSIRNLLFSYYRQAA